MAELLAFQLKLVAALQRRDTVCAEMFFVAYFCVRVDWLTATLYSDHL